MFKNKMAFIKDFKNFFPFFLISLQSF